MTQHVINQIHVLISLSAVTYPFVFKANASNDFIYIILLLMVLYSYIILQGECFISYVIKKYNDPKYVAGTDISVLDDFSDVFKNKTFASYAISYIIVALVIGSFIALKRYNFINIYYIYLFSVLLCIYFFILRTPSLYNVYFNIVFMIYVTFILYKVIMTRHQ